MAFYLTSQTFSGCVCYKLTSYVQDEINKLEILNCEKERQNCEREKSHNYRLNFLFCGEKKFEI